MTRKEQEKKNPWRCFR